MHSAFPTWFVLLMGGGLCAIGLGLIAAGAWCVWHGIRFLGWLA